MGYPVSKAYTASLSMRRTVHHHYSRSRHNCRALLSCRRSIFTANRNVHNPIHGTALMRGAHHGIVLVRFKNRRVLVGWCLRRNTPEAAVSQALRRELRSSFLAYSIGSGTHSVKRIVLLTQPAVVVQLFVSLSAAADGDSLLFLCEGCEVAQWLEFALHIDGTCPISATSLRRQATPAEE